MATFRRARTDSFDHTITGLLTKRADLFNEASRIRDRLAEIRTDLAAIDRSLAILGYEGDLDAMMPRQKREVLFGRGELSRAVMDELRDAAEPMSSREIAQAIVALRDGPQDRRALGDLVKRVSKALRALKQDGRVRQVVDGRGSVRWGVPVE